MKSNNAQNQMGAMLQASYSEPKASYAQSPLKVSPVEDMLDSIDIQLSNAHEKFSIMEHRLQSVRACCPSPIGDACVADNPPTAMEQRLQNIIDTVRYLSTRIGTATDELRI